MKKMAFRCLATLLLVLAAAVVQAQDSAPRDNRFELGPGDVLEVSVWGDQQMTKQALVRPDGYISYPLIGDVAAKGHTVDEVRQEVESRIKAYIPDTPVTVVLLQLQSNQVFVVGKVNRPGAYMMPGQTTVLQALALAGGMTPYAADSSIIVVRSEDGQQQAIPFNYSRISSGRDLSSNIVLKPLDTVVVP